jgi:hypothetical protein
MARTHNAAIRIEETSASTHLGQRWISSYDGKTAPSTAFLVRTTILSASLAVLLHRHYFASDLRVCDMARPRSSICVSIVCSCFNPDDGGNSSFPAVERPLSSTGLDLDPFEHRHLRGQNCQENKVV